MIEFILYFFIFLIIFFFIYIRLKYKFWSIQPVFHFYDFHYWIRNVGIISAELPKKNKFTNFQNIKTYMSHSLTDNQWKNIVAFIQLNYLRNKNNIFHPKLENIKNYFIGHNHPCYWSFYQINEMVQNSKKIIQNNKIVGIMSSRPLKCIIKNINFDLYYVDYLCVDKRHRNRNIAPQIIQTHEYNQSHSNKKISVSLFKREEELTGIIPLTCYDTYCYDFTELSYTTELSDTNTNTNYKLISCDKQNIYYFYHFMKEYSHKWDIYIFPTISNLHNLINSQNIFIKICIVDREIASAYIFKKTCTYLDKGKEVLSCIGSINGTLSNKEFNNMFYSSIISLKNENIYYVSIENISDNKMLIDENYLLKSPTAYFFYNFAHSPFKSSKCLIIN